MNHRGVTTIPWRLPVYLIYCLLLVFTSSRHESWFDEAQAWLLARDLRTAQLWTTYLRYEGSTGLWHTILHLAARSGLPYGAMHVIACLAAAVAAALLLWFAPFPAFITGLLPFTYFLIYQYAVVARNYVLFPALFLLAAILLPHARRQTWLFTTVLILMAATTLHGALAAAGIFVAWLLELRSAAKPLEPGEARRYIAATAVLAAALVLFMATLWPAPDATFLRVSAQTLAPTAESPVAIASQMVDALSFGISPVTEANGLLDRVFANHRMNAGVTLLRCLQGLPTAVVLILSVYWFHKTGTLLYFLLPVGSVLLLAALIYHNHWHSGVLFLIWLFAMWLAAARSQLRMPKYVAVIWVLVLVPHLFWAATSIIYDIRSPYSGSRALAAFLKEEGWDKQVVYGAGYEAMSIQPYFAENLFRNYHGGAPPSFWLWRTSNTFPQVMSSIPAERPDTIVVSLRTAAQRIAANELVRCLPHSGYAIAGRFDGRLFWKTEAMESEDFLVLHKLAR